MPVEHDRKGLAWAFAGFALLLAARDVSFDLYIKHYTNSISYALMLTGSVMAFSLILLIKNGELLPLFRMLRSPTILIKVLILGSLAAVVYGVTFYMIGQIGAGLFDLLDFGFGPIATAILGVAVLGEPLRRNHLIAVITYLTGLLMLLWGRPMSGWSFVLVAILSPIGTALSNLISKQLLQAEEKGLSRPQLLFVRFLPASALLLLFQQFFSSQEFRILEPAVLIPAAIFFGIMPMWMLISGLVRSALTDLAIWEFLIPAGAFFGTRAWYWDNHGQILPIMGAILILIGLAIAHLPSRPLIDGKTI